MPDAMKAKPLFGRPRAEVDAALPDRESVACPICRRTPRPFGVDFQGLHLARCPTCGLEFQHPRPVFAQLATAVYGGAYHRPEEAEADRRHRGLFRRQLARLERLLPADRRTALDVGCGAGAFIRFARDHGWKVDGTDVVVTEWARRTGARLWEGQLPDIAFDGERFDVVRFNHVLEHTQNPLDELRRVRRIVTGEGMLLVGVPNLAGVTNRLKSWQSRLHLKLERWKHYGALHHLWFFTPPDAREARRSGGFRRGALGNTDAGAVGPAGGLDHGPAAVASGDGPRRRYARSLRAGPIRPAAKLRLTPPRRPSAPHRCQASLEVPQRGG